MKKIMFYNLYYTPKGNGAIVLKLEGEDRDEEITALSATDLTAIAAVLSSNEAIFYGNKTFVSLGNESGSLTSSHLSA